MSYLQVEVDFMYKKLSLKSLSNLLLIVYNWLLKN